MMNLSKILFVLGAILFGQCFAGIQVIKTHSDDACATASSGTFVIGTCALGNINSCISTGSVYANIQSSCDSNVYPERESGMLTLDFYSAADCPSTISADWLRISVPEAKSGTNVTLSGFNRDTNQPGLHTVNLACNNGAMVGFFCIAAACSTLNQLAADSCTAITSLNFQATWSAKQSGCVGAPVGAPVAAPVAPVAAPTSAPVSGPVRAPSAAPAKTSSSTTISASVLLIGAALALAY